ncbi:solute carrier family 22 member 18 [Rhynchocyon petersi]
MRTLGPGSGTTFAKANRSRDFEGAVTRTLAGIRGSAIAPYPGGASAAWRGGRGTRKRGGGDSHDAGSEAKSYIGAAALGPPPAWGELPPARACLRLPLHAGLDSHSWTHAPWTLPRDVPTASLLRSGFTSRAAGSGSRKIGPLGEVTSGQVGGVPESCYLVTTCKGQDLRGWGRVCEGRCWGAVPARGDRVSNSAALRLRGPARSFPSPLCAAPTPAPDPASRVAPSAWDQKPSVVGGGWRVVSNSTQVPGGAGALPGAGRSAPLSVQGADPCEGRAGVPDYPERAQRRAHTGPTETAPGPHLLPGPEDFCPGSSAASAQHHPGLLGLPCALPGMLAAGASWGQGPPHSNRGALSRQGVLLLTYVLAALEFTCLFMQFSTMPYLARSLGLDTMAFSYLQTTFGVLQLLGGPVFGRFADQRGARAAYTLSFLASSVLFLLMAAACSPALPGVALLFTSRLPAALMHMLPAAQMVITDLSPPEERPAALGRLGLCFGIGVILGSMLGGTLSTAWGIQCPVLMALAATMLGAALSFTLIPVSTKGTSEDTPFSPPGKPKAGVFDLKAITQLLLLPGVLPVFLIRVVSGFPSGLFLVMFSVISMDFFQLNAAQSGYLTSYSGVLQMVIQGLLVGRLSSRFSEGTLLQASVLVFVVVGLAMALMSSVYHFCLLMPGLVFSLCVLNVVTDSMLTKSVSASDTGTMLGLCATVQPLTRTVGPTLGGLLYHHFGVAIFGHVQAVVNLLVFLMLWRRPVPQKRD